MQRTCIVCWPIISWMLLASAEAASYEVIPTNYERNVINSSYIYVATVFDNTEGRVFVCSVTYTEISGKTLAYSCHDQSREIRSVDAERGADDDYPVIHLAGSAAYARLLANQREIR
jgi:hypothetical protein